MILIVGLFDIIIKKMSLWSSMLRLDLYFESKNARFEKSGIAHVNKVAL